MSGSRLPWTSLVMRKPGYKDSILHWSTPLGCWCAPILIASMASSFLSLPSRTFSSTSRSTARPLHLQLSSNSKCYWRNSTCHLRWTLRVLGTSGPSPSPRRCVLLADSAQLRSAKFQIDVSCVDPNALEIYTAQVRQRKQIYFRWSSAI